MFTTTVAELLGRAIAEAPDRPARYLVAGAAANRLSAQPLVLTGSAAHFIHTGLPRRAPVELLGSLSHTDRQRFANAGLDADHGGFTYHRGGSTLRFVVDAPLGDLLKAPQRFEIMDVGVPVVSSTDLMLDRALRALDGTRASREEAAHLAIACHGSIDWYRLAERADTMSVHLPAVIAHLHAMGA